MVDDDDADMMAYALIDAYGEQDGDLFYDLDDVADYICNNEQVSEYLTHQTNQPNNKEVPTMTNNQPTWRVVGFDTKHDRHEYLLYIKDTAAEAYKTATQLHPTLDIYFVQQVD